MNNNKIILDLCGGTSSWAKPYKDAGYDVRTITLPEHDIRDEKLQAELIALKPYGILAAPPCTKFSKAAWQIKKADRNFSEGMECVRACLNVIWGVQEQGAPLAFWSHIKRSISGTHKCLFGLVGSFPRRRFKVFAGFINS